ncbi:RNase H-like domain found in reverse transcriptase [Popillia japonica]|uniref:RNase H-like domain found in reverse transcriptase n=1 Tax=Popillia japonica TaxID=7064 RepID=A0AAW1MH58_POPJA
MYFLTSLDIKSAYWQIPIEEASRPYTAFTVPNRGLFQFCRLPFGLCNAPAVWVPLTGLLRKNQVFRWTTSCEDAWSQIRQHLISAPILSCPDFNQEFIIQTDASNFGLGAVLTQRIDGDERVICYLSRSLSRAERIYSTTEKECLAVLWAIEKLRPYVEGSHFTVVTDHYSEKECLAVLWAIEKLRPYVEGSHFTVVTDHYSLCWLNKLVSPSGRLARWAVRLQQYDFTIVHRSGKDHVVPDALSRSVPVVDTISDDFVSTDKWYSKLLRNVREHPHKFPKFQVINGQLCKYVRSSNQYFDNEDEDWKIVVSKDRRAELIKCSSLS